jgi:3-hydroxyisobutyrate dehydrogenase-like beta-hydroxyacid dehydrogenase
MQLAFLGLGRMGSGMARNLLRAGHHVKVYNRSRAKAEALAANGAEVAHSPADACHGAEVAVSMLADDQAVMEAALGNRGIADGLAAGAIHVSSSTVSTAASRELAAAHSSKGQGFVAATVFGRPEAAEAGKLLVIAAGAADAVARCRPIFDGIGRQTIVAGSEPWQANAVKVCGNFMLASLLESFGEAYATLRKSGVPPQVFLEAMNALFGSPVYANYGRAIAEEQFEPAGFALKLGAKDVRLALAVAEECASPMPLASLLRDQFLSAAAHGQGELDWSSVALVAARAAGLEVKKQA